MAAPRVALLMPTLFLATSVCGDAGASIVESYCFSSCDSPCGELSGDIAFQCGSCQPPTACRPDAAGFLPAQRRRLQPVTHSARSMCDAAKAQVATLGTRAQQIIDRFSDGLPDMKMSEVAAVGFHRRLWEQHKPTRVLRMVLSDELRDAIVAEARAVRQAEQAIFDHLGEQRAFSSYNPWTLQFENAVFFLPSCVEFMDANREVVRANFPEYVDCQCNLFMPDASSLPYGLHHASAYAFEVPRGDPGLA